MAAGYVGNGLQLVLSTRNSHNRRPINSNDRRDSADLVHSCFFGALHRDLKHYRFQFHLPGWFAALPVS